MVHSQRIVYPEDVLEAKVDFAGELSSLTMTVQPNKTCVHVAVEVIVPLI